MTLLTKPLEFLRRVRRTAKIESTWNRLNRCTNATLEFEAGQTYTLSASGVPFLSFKKGRPGERMLIEDLDDMTTPEGKVKKRVKDMLKAFAPDVWYTMPLTAGFGNSGTPDILACCWGHFLAVECKAGNNTTTALQDREIAAINAAGGKALVINERNLDTLAVTLAAWKGEYEHRHLHDG